MSEQEPSPNGTEESGKRKRPAWYIEFEPVEDDRSGAEVLRDTFGDEPLPMTPEQLKRTKEFLDQFLVPREE